MLNNARGWWRVQASSRSVHMCEIRQVLGAGTRPHRENILVLFSTGNKSPEKNMKCLILLIVSVTKRLREFNALTYFLFFFRECNDVMSHRSSTISLQNYHLVVRYGYCSTGTWPRVQSVFREIKYVCGFSKSLVSAILWNCAPVRQIQTGDFNAVLHCTAAYCSEHSLNTRHCCLCIDRIGDLSSEARKKHDAALI